MAIELEELKKRLQSNASEFDGSFGEFSKVYSSHTNENVKEYIKELKDKSVLCVSGSGDHLLNSIVAGAKEVDTFDINRFSPLYQELNIYAIRYLKPSDAHTFLCLFDRDIYYKFNKHLPQHLKEFFDCLFEYDSFEEMLYKFFVEFITTLEFNNYNSLKALQELRERIMKVKRHHYHSDLYSLPGVLDKKYDAIYLSNILEYQKDFTKYFEIIRELKKNHLNEGGEIFYNYLWGKPADIKIEKCYKKGVNRYISPQDVEKNRDIIDSTTKVIVESTYRKTYDLKKAIAPDIVLKTRKGRN